MEEKPSKYQGYFKTTRKSSDGQLTRNVPPGKKGKAIPLQVLRVPGG
jgi:hypothetical protein